MSIPDRLGDYRVIEEIGRGGFGIVYRAHQESLDRPVALKVLYRHLIHTQEQISRFEREARAAARLDHPSVVSVYAWGEANDDFYIAQRLIGSGRTLADELSRYREEGAVPKGWFRKVAKDLALIAEGLAQAHDRGIVHRDVKPSNILLDENLAPSLGDFGLAKIEDGLELSRTGDFAGSPFYMSPEQADSRVGEVDHRSDVYSLGVTLYEMLTMTQPFQGTSSAEIMRKILTEDPKRPTKIESRVPQDLETICLKAMEKNPMRRYPSAIEFANDLNAYLDGEPISAVPIGRTRRLVRRARRHSAVLTGVILTIVFGCVLYFAVQGNKHDADKLNDMTATLGQVTQQGLVQSAEAEREAARLRVQKEADKAIEEAEDPVRAMELREGLQTELEAIDRSYDYLADQLRTAVDEADPEMLQKMATEMFSGGGIMGALKAAGKFVLDSTSGPLDGETVALADDPGELVDDESEDDLVLTFDGFGIRAVPRSRLATRAPPTIGALPGPDGPVASRTEGPKPPSATAPGTKSLGKDILSLFGVIDDEADEVDDGDEEDDPAQDDATETDDQNG